MKRLVLALWLLAAPAWGQQITALPAAGTPLSGTEQIYLVQGGISKQTTIGNLFNAGNVFSTLTVTGAATIGGGLVVGSPPGGNLGAGTVNATAYFLNGLPFTGGGGGGSVCGATGQVQFNNAGTFGCDSTFTFNSSTKAVTASTMTLTGAGNALVIPSGSGIGGTGLIINPGGTLTINGAETVTSTLQDNKAIILGSGTQTNSGSALLHSFSESINETGTTTAPAGYYNFFNITGDTLTSTNGMTWLGVYGNLGGAAMRGPRNAFAASATLTAPSGNSLANNGEKGTALVGLVGSASFNSSDNGTALTNDGIAGAAYGINTYSQFTAGTNLGFLIGYEPDLAASAGVTYGQAVGLSFGSTTQGNPVNQTTGTLIGTTFQAVNQGTAKTALSFLTALHTGSTGMGGFPHRRAGNAGVLGQQWHPVHWSTDRHAKHVRRLD